MKEVKIDAFKIVMTDFEKLVVDETIGMSENLDMETYWSREDLMISAVQAIESIEGTGDELMEIMEGENFEWRKVPCKDVQKILMEFNNLVAKLPENSLVTLPEFEVSPVLP